MKAKGVIRTGRMMMNEMASAGVAINHEQSRGFVSQWRYQIRG